MPEVYKDVAQPSAKEIGSVLGRSVKALLSPVRGLLWGWEKIEETIVEGVSKRFVKIPEENRQTPAPEIAVPLIQAFSYTAHNEILREMYLNLLANAMDNSKDNDVHPSFVEMIKHMNSLDAKLFQELSKRMGHIKAINPTISVVDKGQYFIGATPEWFLGWTIPNYDIFQISASLVRLGKLGIVELMYDRTAGAEEYEEMRNAPILTDILKQYQQNNPALNLEVGLTKSICYVNEYGKQFAKCCL